MRKKKLIKLENQTNEAICLPCNTTFANDRDTIKYIKERFYDALRNKYCEQCGNQLYHLQI